MAQMIPEKCVSKSGLEKDFFSYIKDAKGTNDWIVFHSVKFDTSSNNKEGECDFVIIIPDSGVFIVEAKGGKISYSCGDKFVSIDKNNKKHDIFPFSQLEKEKDELNNIFTSNGLSNIPIFGFVMFDGQKDDHRISHLDTEKRKDIYYFKSYKFVDFIKEIFNRYNGMKRFYNESIVGIKKSLETKSIFISDENLFIQKEAIIRNNTENSIDEKMKEIINDNVICSPRALIYGGAGTGKTYFASVLLKRIIESNRFKKIAFFSYNILFSQFINERFKEYVNSDSLIVEPIVEFFIKYSRECGLTVNKPINDGDEAEYIREVKYFYSVLVYEKFMEAIEIKPLKFDVIIVDEAQDIVNPRALVALSLILNGKIYGGNWYFFGDFTHQLIYENSVSRNDMNQFLLSMGFDEEGDYKRIPLIINCRNSVKIVNALNEQFNQNIIPMANAIEGNVKYKPYSDKIEEMKSLEHLLEELINKKGYSKDSISILSNDSNDEDVVIKNIQESITSFSFNSYDKRENDQISVSKVRRFKGLENDIIILIDLNDYLERNTNKQNIDILYIGLTRAFSYVYVYETQSEKVYREKEKERMGMSINGKTNS